MNSIEEESTIFTSIEKNNIKTQIHNFKKMKSKYFSKPIKALTFNKVKTHKTSTSFPTHRKKHYIIKKNPFLYNQTNKSNIIPNMKIKQDYITKENKSKSFLLTNKNYNIEQNIEYNLDENIVIDDIDEFYDINLNININKPRLLNHNKNYYNHDSSNLSRNILNSYFNKTTNTNLNLSKMNIYHNRYKVYKNKSESFSSSYALKLKLNQNISLMDSKIDLLKTLINKRNIEILSLKILFEKNNTYHKRKKNNKIFKNNIDEMRKIIFNLKLKKSKIEDKYINKKLLDKEIKKENILFSAKKAEILEKILDFKIRLLNNIKNNQNSTNNYLDDSTIINDSYILDNEFNMLGTSENEKINMPKDKSIINNKNLDKYKKININEINCFKNKNISNYFSPRFFVETKSYHKNKYLQQQLKQNQKFNIFINYHDEK